MFIKSKKLNKFDAELTKIDKILKESEIKFKVAEVFKIGEISYENESILLKVKNAFTKRDLNYLLSLNDVDISKDLIQIYLLIDDKENNLLLGIIDPYELYDNPVLLAKIENINYDYKSIKHKSIK